MDRILDAVVKAVKANTIMSLDVHFEDDSSYCLKAAWTLKRTLKARSALTSFNVGFARWTRAIFVIC
eukprot:CAMPEP_0115313174 /NCGR_PEP_ID=MMETSP0270-20121206/76323_1 /TAXON_ID=71861 /ORGANISM="Scrippsiella trochoidea, Strain CCMP3099" /LENGTH=66 /DNA_ID=CAMNT_0002732245 /DNA_START=48 /DNA_END=245 /DNA_ORIENTATION=-